jgi:hypothetical protein
LTIAMIIPATTKTTSTTCIHSHQGGRSFMPNR